MKYFLSPLFKRILKKIFFLIVGSHDEVKRFLKNL